MLSWFLPHSQGMLKIQFFKLSPLSGFVVVEDVSLEDSPDLIFVLLAFLEYSLRWRKIIVVVCVSFPIVVWIYLITFKTTGTTSLWVQHEILYYVNYFLWIVSSQYHHAFKPIFSFSAQADLKHVLKFKEEERNGKMYFTVESYRLYINITGYMKFKFENLFNGDKKLSDTLHKVANDNWKEISQDIKEGLEDACSIVATEFAKKVFYNVPVFDIFLKN